MNAQFYAVHQDGRGRIVETLETYSKGTLGACLASESTGVTYKTARAASEAIGAKNREIFAAARAAA
jgi:hypothetical protein